jgi:transposase
MRIFVATELADFRRGIDGLAALCRQRLEQDPMSGCAFVFRNRRGTAIKILLYDGQGFWLCQKLAGGDADAARGAPQWRPVQPAV